MTELATVHYSTTGGRFHRIPDCPAYEMGRNIWDTDEPRPGWPSTPVFLQRPVATAMGAGKLPCTRCLPGLLAAWYQGTCEEDFGHTPIDEYPDHDSISRIICARCIRWTRWADVSLYAGRAVDWPCTSAIVLGLAPRQERND